MQTNKRKTIIKQTFSLLVSNYREHEVGKNAAALAYYLLFTIFPLMIFFSNLLGVINISVEFSAVRLDRFMPRDVVGLLESYFEYVSISSNYKLMWFSLIFSVWFPMRAANGVMDSARLAYHLGKPKNIKHYRIRQLVYTLVLLIVVVLCLALTLIGKNVMLLIWSVVPNEWSWMAELSAAIWQYFRFIPICLLMFSALGVLYTLALDKPHKRGAMLPGMVVSVIVWTIGSIVFSFYVENIGSYSVIYGALGAMIVLLIWLYMTSISIIIGIEFNAALETVRGKEFEIMAEIKIIDMETRIKKLKKDIPAISLALKDKKTPLVAKVLAGVTIVYALSPIDIVPDFIPVLGYLDDVIILPALIALTIKYIPQDILEQCRIQSEGMWENGKPKKWYYAIPVLLIWAIVILIIYKIIF